MDRIKLLNIDEAPEKSKELLEPIKADGRRILNIQKVMANSPAALGTFFGVQHALKDKTLDLGITERIAVRLAVLNGCEYCLAAHSYSGGKILSEDEVLAARQGKSSDAKAQAALDFAELVMKKAGKVSDEEFAAAKDAGLSDTELLDIVTVVALNFFTNAVNGVAQTKVDFPKPKE